MKKKIALYESLQLKKHAVELHTEDCGHYFHENGRQRAYTFLKKHLQSEASAEQGDAPEPASPAR